MRAIRVAIIGDFDRGKHSHWASEAALFHAAARLGIAVEPCWIGTESLAASAARLDQFDGVWGAPGSPYASFDGMLRGIERARTRDLPFLGTCGGFQYALIELSRNVLGLADADSAENDPEGANVVITPVGCEVPRGPRLCGGKTVRVMESTLLAKLCGAELAAEFFCSFETNPAYVERWQAAGLRVAARGPEGEMRAFELSGRRFFVATLFQPQLSSSFAAPHPLIMGFLRAMT
jgi:CTP synthase (UTP-ammonia lyase)